jgi:hypothetical protein
MKNLFSSILKNVLIHYLLIILSTISFAFYYEKIKIFIYVYFQYFIVISFASILLNLYLLLRIYRNRNEFVIFQGVPFNKKTKYPNCPNCYIPLGRTPKNLSHDPNCPILMCSRCKFEIAFDLNQT